MIYNQLYLRMPDSWKFARHRQLHRGAVAAWATEPVVFLHIPKAAGTSLNRAMGMPDLGHLTYRQLHRKAPGCFDERKTYVGVIRDPLERLFSTYHYVRRAYEKKGRTALIDMALCPDFESFLRKFLSKRRVESHFFLRPSSRFIEGVPTGRLILLSFARLAEGVDTLNAMLGTQLVLPECNLAPVRKRLNLSETTELARIVYKIYADDMEIIEELNRSPSAILEK